MRRYTMVVIHDDLEDVDDEDENDDHVVGEAAVRGDQHPRNPTLSGPDVMKKHPEKKGEKLTKAASKAKTKEKKASAKSHVCIICSKTFTRNA